MASSDWGHEHLFVARWRHDQRDLNHGAAQSPEGVLERRGRLRGLRGRVDPGGFKTTEILSHACVEYPFACYALGRDPWCLRKTVVRKFIRTVRAVERERERKRFSPGGDSKRSQYALVPRFG